MMRRKTSDFSRRLRNLFVLAGLRQEVLACRAGVAVETVRQWESGAKLPDVEQLKVIAAFFGLPYAWFLDGRDGMPTSSDMAALLGLSEDTVCLLMELAENEPEEVLDAVDDAVYAVIDAMQTAREV